MNPDAIAKICQTASEKAAATNWGGIVALAVFSALFLFVTMYLMQRELSRADEKIKRANEACAKMLEKHEKCSALMVNALNNPRANVQVVLTTKGISFDGVATTKPARDVS